MTCPHTNWDDLLQRCHDCEATREQVLAWFTHVTPNQVLSPDRVRYYRIVVSFGEDESQVQTDTRLMDALKRQFNNFGFEYDTSPSVDLPTVLAEPQIVEASKP